MKFVLLSDVTKADSASESRVLIGYPRRQEGPILPARELPRLSREKMLSFWPYNKFFIDQTCSVNLAYVCLVFFAFLLTSSLSIDSQKKNMANIQAY